MNENKDQNPITIEETKRLLGAEDAIPLEHVKFNPLTANKLVAKVHDRLISTGGRPTDPAWGITRKVPMRREMWEKLISLAKEFEQDGRRISPGQLAAIALEQGISRLFESENPHRDHEDEVLLLQDYPIAHEIEEEAGQLCSAINDQGLW